MCVSESLRVARSLRVPAPCLPVIVCVRVPLFVYTRRSFSVCMCWALPLSHLSLSLRLRDSRAESAESPSSSLRVSPSESQALSHFKFLSLLPPPPFISLSLSECSSLPAPVSLCFVTPVRHAYLSVYLVYFPSSWCASREAFTNNLQQKK